MLLLKLIQVLSHTNTPTLNELYKPFLGNEEQELILARVIAVAVRSG